MRERRAPGHGQKIGVRCDWTTSYHRSADLLGPTQPLSGDVAYRPRDGFLRAAMSSSDT